MSSIGNTIFLFLTFLVASIVPTISQSCNSYRFSNNINYAACEDLSVLESSLHWNYHPASGVVDVAFNKANAKDSSWVAWTINPTSKGMLGSQSFVAVHKSNATIKAYTSITSYATMLEEGDLSFSVYSLSASYTNGRIIIFASFQLPSNKTVMNHASQEGLVSDDDTLMPHSFSSSNLQSHGTIDFISGKVSKPNGDVNSRATLGNVRNNLNPHGIMMPIGVMVGRYLKVFDGLGDTWFHLHRPCQSLAFFIAIVGFGSGLYIGNHYGVHHAPLRCVGITLMCLASAQICVSVFSGLNKDHKYKTFWNILRYIVGYTTIALTIWNVLKGFEILNVDNVWKNSYLGIIISLGAIIVVLEVITWIWICDEETTTDS
ncbi:hypothetical protein DEO72_LG1g1819 [Vigna unguiculata]|uniref:Cytochrome b561 and DOMON domain-containing protein n=1 Tax=Vigna unguiculata TaxID=3917 RepID=A0A4D6KNP7_VIGUN|nr:hypothetical protein DEO72_LG1g1817 [Vigna unguiculata]QCD78186.1 hypothetical protein DEO72_LG1g1818 [Vigna unguiculata]QCD78187.1 hypothetical protein DEO72_LG1g1819 [Vigna unguiculata]